MMRHPYKFSKGRNHTKVYKLVTASLLLGFSLRVRAAAHHIATAEALNG